MIYINVVNQKMSVSSSQQELVSGSQNFVKFKFNLSDDWNGLRVFAQFKQNEVAYNQYLDSDNCAYLPAEIKAGNCTLTLYGSMDRTIGTSNCLIFDIKESTLVENGESTVVSQSLYNQLVSRISALEKTVKNLQGS